MKTLNEATSRELEIAQVRLAVVKTDAAIAHFERTIPVLREKNLRRHKEIVMQETLMRVKPPNDPSSATRPARRVNCNREVMAGFAAAHG